jgi:aspartyl-tRNA synthetase
MDVRSLVEQWLRYAAANRFHAARERKAGDLFGAELAVARGEVRRAAADLLRKLADDPVQAAKLMHDQVKILWIVSFPIVGFDEAAVKYTKARTWQDCARTIDPQLPIVQKCLALE